ncbi:MAG: hypothetical protein HGA78_12345, partial [Nitrospirales bacterium]|nr:hypothetical protein [Nitrospirales bacterium]
MQQQCALPLEQDEQNLRRWIEKTCGRPVSLIMTDNATSMLSMRRNEGSLVLRIHRLFLSAGPDVLEEVGNWIKGKKI